MSEILRFCVRDGVEMGSPNTRILRDEGSCRIADGTVRWALVLAVPLALAVEALLIGVDMINVTGAGWPDVYTSEDA